MHLVALWRIRQYSTASFKESCDKEPITAGISKMRVIHIVCATLFASVYADSVFDVSVPLKSLDSAFPRVFASCSSQHCPYAVLSRHQRRPLLLCQGPPRLREAGKIWSLDHASSTHLTFLQREGGVSTCYSDATVYCGGCGADCCTYDPDAPTYDDDSESGSKWTSSTNLAGTYCKN